MYIPAIIGYSLTPNKYLDVDIIRDLEREQAEQHRMAMGDGGTGAFPEDISSQTSVYDNFGFSGEIINGGMARRDSNQTFSIKIKQVLKNKAFIFLALTLSSLFFIITGI